MGFLDPKPPTRVELSATYLPKWKPNTAYTAGAQVVAPTGETVSAKVAFTSGATFSAANWNFPASGGGAVASVVGQTGAVSGSQIIADTTVAGALNAKLDASQKGAASGVASLDAGSKVPAAQVPDLSGTYATGGALTAHTGNVSNPHAVTKAQVGLGNVDNTADTSKPVSTAQQAALDAKLDTLSRLYGNFSYASIHPVTSTINAAVSAAGTANNFPTNYDAHPGLRRAVLVPPGTYTETTITLPPYVDLIGTTLNPADVTINGTGNTDGIKTQGGNLIAGITMVNTGSAFGIHPVWNGRDMSVTLHKVTINSTGTGGSLAGQILAGQSFYARDCTFTAANQYAVYFHNILPVMGRSSSVVFDNCTAYCTSTNALLLNDENSDPSTFIWKGVAGSITSGAGNAVSLSLLAGTGTVNALFSAGSYSTISNAFGAAFLNTWPNLPAPKPVFPQPSVYGGDSRGVALPLQPMITDSSAQTVTALRQYFWPVKVTSISRFNNLYTGVSGTAAGNLNMLIYQDNAGKPGTLITQSGSKVAASGLNTYTAANSRVLFPGTYWLAVVFDSATVTPVCSTNAPLVQPMFYQDVAAIATNPNPAVPVALTAGPVPIVSGMTI